LDARSDRAKIHQLPRIKKRRELVYEYLSLTVEDREIVCSPDLRHKHEFTSGAEETEYQVIDHARWLRQYADPFLRGDFSLWLAIHEYKLAKLVGEVRQSWKKEVSRRFVGLTEGRNAIYVQEHMFQSDVDYLAPLKAKK
jgi:hypothetical protein